MQTGPRVRPTTVRPTFHLGTGSHCVHTYMPCFKICSKSETHRPISIITYGTIELVANIVYFIEFLIFITCALFRSLDQC